MIPLPGFITTKLLGIGLAGSLIASLVLGGGLVITRARLSETKANFSAFVERVKAANAKVEAAGLARLVLTQKAQNDALQKTLETSRARSNALAARYDGLRARYGQDRAAPIAVPDPAADAGRFIICPTDRGFWCIRPEVGLAILHAGDVAVQRVHDLLDFNERQAGITVEIPSDVENN